MIGIALVFAFGSGPQAQQQQDAPPYVAQKVPWLKVEYSDLEFKPWAEKADDALIAWYPKIEDLLKVKRVKTVAPVVVVIETHGSGVAGTGNRHVTVNGEYLLTHPNDVGLIVHEETHIVQAYPRNRAGWLVEGIADWVRWFHYEPKSARPHVNPNRANYRQGYQVAAAFLDWVSQKYDKNLVPALNKALHDGVYSPDIWVQLTKHSVDDLWTDYISNLRILNPQPK